MEIVGGLDGKSLALYVVLVAFGMHLGMVLALVTQKDAQELCDGCWQ